MLLLFSAQLLEKTAISLLQSVPALIDQQYCFQSHEKHVRQTQVRFNSPLSQKLDEIRAQPWRMENVHVTTTIQRQQKHNLKQRKKSSSIIHVVLGSQTESNQGLEGKGCWKCLTMNFIPFNRNTRWSTKNNCSQFHTIERINKTLNWMKFCVTKWRVALRKLILDLVQKQKKIELDG